MHLGIYERTNRPESKQYGSVQDETQAVFMNNYNGDSIMKGLWKKVESGPKESPTRECPTNAEKGPLDERGWIFSFSIRFSNTFCYLDNVIELLTAATA